MNKREMQAVETVLTDPENSSRTGSEVAELVIQALDDIRARGSYPVAVGNILTDPENRERSPALVAKEALDALEEIRSRTHRLAVVGQIQYRPQGVTHTVILGPFSARGILDTKEKFQRATEGGTAARDAGQHLAWDSKTGIGRGRFMLAPAFRRPQDAWDFFRGPTKRDVEPMNLLTAPPAHIAAAVARWEAGLWAAEHHQTPRP